MIRHRTVRICQREKQYVLFLKELVVQLGARAWTYREDKDRNLYVVEFARSVLQASRIVTRTEKIDYIGGHFDAEGGVLSTSRAEPYLYLAQKNRSDLENLRQLLVQVGIKMRSTHNPSRRVAPEYWRFDVSRKSIGRFISIIGSWHPRKSRILDHIAPCGLDRRMKVIFLPESRKDATSYNIVM